MKIKEIKLLVAELNYIIGEKDFKYEFTIVGSASLKLLGLLDRDLKDLDLVLYCKNMSESLELVDFLLTSDKMKNCSPISEYEGGNNNIKFTWKGLKVDIFPTNVCQKVLQLDTNLNFGSIIDTFNHKYQFDKKKADDDLTSIVNKLVTKRKTQVEEFIENVTKN